MKFKFEIKKKNILWNLLIIFSWLPAFAYCFGVQPLVPVGTYGTTVLLTLFFVNETIKIINRKVKMVFILISIFLVFIGVSVYLRRENWVDKSFRNYIYLLLIFEGLELCYIYIISPDCFKILYRIPLILTICMAVTAIFPTSYDLNRYSSALYLHYQNPNILSLVLFFAVIFLCLGYIDEKKIIYLYSLLVDIVLILLTHARSCLIGLILILFFMLFYKNTFNVNKFMMIICTLIPVFSLLFLPFVLKYFTFQIWGKSADAGRIQIWNNVLNEFMNNRQLMIYGRGKYDTEAYYLMNSHNAYLQFMCNFGVPIFIFILISLIAVGFYFVSFKNNDKYNFIAFVGLIGVYINAGFETHLADGITGMTFMWIILYMVVISRSKLVKGI